MTSAPVRTSFRGWSDAMLDELTKYSPARWISSIKSHARFSPNISAHASMSGVHVARQVFALTRSVATGRLIAVFVDAEPISSVPRPRP